MKKVIVISMVILMMIVTSIVSIYVGFKSGYDRGYNDYEEELISDYGIDIERLKFESTLVSQIKQILGIETIEYENCLTED